MCDLWHTSFSSTVDAFQQSCPSHLRNPALENMAETLASQKDSSCLWWQTQSFVGSAKVPKAYGIRSWYSLTLWWFSRHDQQTIEKLGFQLYPLLVFCFFFFFKKKKMHDKTSYDPSNSLVSANFSVLRRGGHPRPKARRNHLESNRQRFFLWPHSMPVQSDFFLEVLLINIYISQLWQV